VKKFIERNRVNRIVLLSDGLANVGPSSPGELGELGWSLAKDSISVTTIGLGDGYNEDLMVSLARESDGNHAFAENASDLARLFSNEFGDLTSVIARDVLIQIQCLPGIRPIRTLGRHTEITGSVITARINQIYAEQEKFLLLEVEVPPRTAGTDLGIAEVSIRYFDPLAKTFQSLKQNTKVQFAESIEAVDRNRNKDVMISSVELIANETNKNALLLRDQGKTKEAERLLDKNAVFLDKAATEYKSKRLSKSADRNRKAKKKLDSSSWRVQRKRMRSEQHMLEAQQAWE
jgi:Ca-activated chloride channel family protein